MHKTIVIKHTVNFAADITVIVNVALWQAYCYGRPL